MSTDTIHTVARVRCFNGREIMFSERLSEPLRPIVKAGNGNNANGNADNEIVLLEHTRDDLGFPIEKERERFQFDRVFWTAEQQPSQENQQQQQQSFATQETVYDHTGKQAVQDLLAGYNVCVMAVGQTGTGKTHTMIGTATNPGIIPRFLDSIYDAAVSRDSTTGGKTTTLTCSFYEIYNEKCQDLLVKKTSGGGNNDFISPRIRQHPTQGVFVDGLSKMEFTDAAKAKSIMERGFAYRTMSATKMGTWSSRSHLIVEISAVHHDAAKGTHTHCSARLVDTAGSETLLSATADGSSNSHIETSNINRSITTLRRVIDTLVANTAIKNKKHHKLPPFRESVLTYVLFDCLGGNCKTTVIACLSPHSVNTAESLATLRFAAQIRQVPCNPKVNEENTCAILDVLQDEIALLQKRLASSDSNNNSVVGDAELLNAEISMRVKERDALLGRKSTTAAAATATDQPGALSCGGDDPTAVRT